MISDIRGATGHPVRLICETLEVPRSSYYHAARPTPAQTSDQAMGMRIESIFRSHRGRYLFAKHKYYSEVERKDINNMKADIYEEISQALTGRRPRGPVSLFSP